MILATNNKGKLEEIRKILKEYQIYSLNEKQINIDVEENQDTFYGNALKKAKEIHEITKDEVVADDSGLCIDALDGFPGILTHRFLGEDATDEERNEKLIELTNGKNNRNASVVCNLVYYDGKTILVGEGVLKGTIAREPRGENGFGFDPIFELEDGRTLAELTMEEKNLVSARHLAAVELAVKIKQYKK